MDKNRELGKIVGRNLHKLILASSYRTQAAFAVAFAVSLAAIRFLMDFVRRHTFTSFGIYRIALGAVVLGYFLIAGR